MAKSPLIADLMRRPASLSWASRYTAANGLIYLASGGLLAAWPGAVQALFKDPAFVGREEGLMRVIGLAIAIIGWIYLFGGRCGARQIVAASIVERLIFVPLVLGSLAWAGVFPHLLAAISILDPLLALGGWFAQRLGQD